MTPLFTHRHLAAKARLIVSVVEARAIGKLFAFTVRSARQPVVAVACLAPGSTVPNRGC